MSFTIYGVIILGVAGYLMLRPGLNALLIFVMFCSVFGAAAAINLPALGGSSIPPAFFALGFLVLRVALSPDARSNVAIAVCRENSLLILYCVYSAVTAVLLPRLFHGIMDVTTLRTTHGATGIELYVPLTFTSQNITTAVYMIGTLGAAIGASFVCARRGSDKVIVRAAIALVWFLVATALVDLALTAVGHRDLLNIFRNGSYAQLSQEVGGIVRIQGVFSEPSGFAAYGFVFFVFMVELWLRDVQTQRTGVAALVLGALLLLSTSSTAYVSIGAYSLILSVRLLIFRRQVALAKVLMMGLFLICFVCFALAITVFDAQLATKAGNILKSMTIDKGHSQSGVQRGAWARQGLKAFTLTHGLGIGAGSFRSSSLFTAIAGSTGVVGLLSFHLYLINVFKPLRASTYGAAPNDRIAAGAAAACAAIFGLISAEAGAPAPDPGLLFGLFCGMAIAWRLPLRYTTFDRQHVSALNNGSALPQPALESSGAARAHPGYPNMA